MKAIWRVAWSNPYTQPPGGRPRVLAEHQVTEWESSGKHCPDDLDALAAECTGYGISVSFWPDTDTPRRTWSREAKARNRKRKLEKRLKAKYPMFWRQFYDQKLAENPLYYEARDPVFDGTDEQWAARREGKGEQGD